VISIAVVAGTRPEIIKLSPIIKSLAPISGIEFDFIHTGQHYDWNMSQVFFEELSLPKPSHFLGIGSGTHAHHLAMTVTRLQKYLAARKTSWLVVEGDTNSAMAAAITAAKLRIPVAHVEAGCRSYDLSMPEELNRRIISECAALNFTPTENCTLNLMREGFSLSRIAFTGHPIVEVVNEAQRRMNSKRTCNQFGVQPNEFVLATFHREENVDDRGKLRTLIRSLARIGSTIVFPIHPRTQRRIREFGFGSYLKRSCFVAIPPMKYIDTLAMIKNAAFVFTDSGGMQQEALMLGTPCLTARNTTEWIETVLAGGNTLIGTSKTAIMEHSRYLLENVSIVKTKLKDVENPFGDGKATLRIVRTLLEARIGASTWESMDFLTDGLPESRIIKVNRKFIAPKELRRFLPYVNMIFDRRETPIVFRAKQPLKRGHRIWMFGPQRALERFRRCCVN